MITSPGFSKGRPAVLVGLWAMLFLPGTALAFPPAPSFTIYGIARDEFGWALATSSKGTVIVKRNGSVIGQAPIDDASRVGENFRVQLAMDLNPADPYRTGAQTSGTLFSIEVKFPTSTMLVTMLKASQTSIGQPGGSVFVDFSVGEDTDGDGIPDAWEWWQLSAAGIGPGDPRWSLATLGTGDFDHDGTPDYIEYLAGTFAFLAEESLNLKIDGFEADGSARMFAFVVVDKTYRLESSTDLKKWTMAPIRPDSPNAPSLINWKAADTRQITLYSDASVGQQNLFYRLVLVR